MTLVPVRAVPILLVVSLSATHQQARGQQPFFKEGQGSRRGSPPAWDTVWVFDGRDDLLSGAVSLVPDSHGGVYFADPFLRKVYHVDPRGNLDWSWGREGGGPGELRDVRAMALNSSGNLVLVDSRNRRIVTLTPEGQLLREVPLAIDAGYVFGVVVLGSDQYVMSTDGPAPWMLADDGGRQVQVVDTPQGFSRLSFRQRFGQMAKWKDDRWVFGFQNGNGWFTFRSGSVALASPYVEHTESLSEDVTRLANESVHSAVSLSVRGDTLAVLFAGSTRGHSYWLDRYDLQSGDYVDSLILPLRAQQAVWGIQGHFFVVTYDTFPTLMALKPNSHHPTGQRKDND